jgi:hypothetical protein
MTGQLSDFAEVDPREPPLPDDCPFVTMADVEPWGHWARTSGTRNGRGGARARGNDVLLARITPCLENGKIAQAPERLGRVGASTEFTVLRAGTSILPDFLFLWAGSPETHQRAISLMVGTTGRQRAGHAALRRGGCRVGVDSENSYHVDQFSGVRSSWSWKAAEVVDAYHATHIYWFPRGMECT